MHMAESSGGAGKAQFGLRTLLLVVTAASPLFALAVWWPAVGVGTIVLLSSIGMSAAFAWLCAPQDVSPVVQGIRLVVTSGNILLAALALVIAAVGLTGATDTGAQLNMRLATEGTSLFALAAISAVALLASRPLLFRRCLVAAGAANSLLLLYAVWSLGSASEDAQPVALLYAIALINANALTLRYVSAKSLRGRSS